MIGRAPRLVGAAAFLVLAAGVFVTAGGDQEVTFPHEDHEGLFPLCAGCHSGIEDQDPSTSYPEPELCVNCHDGGDLDEVRWEGPSRASSNVRFEHDVHAERLQAEGDPAQSCEACHSESPEQRMTVDTEEELDTCWSCHAHEVEEHFDVAAQCESCHVSLVETGFGLDRLEALPRPSSHEDALFVPEQHGSLVAGYADRCATCHTADRCLTCHVDGTLVEITAIPIAPVDMELPSAEAEYPVPATHVDEGWLDAHKVQVPVRECSTCHTQDDCRSCHIGIVPSFVEALPRRADVLAPGVGLVESSPGSHESVFFFEAHPTLAASDDRTCTVCHLESYCVECHDGPPDGGYHPPSFVAKHAANAFARTEECATCHSAEVFCRACHEDMGLGGRGRLGSGYHDAEPVWLLRHGQAARQNLETCSSCHAQADCVQCHGLLGAFSVSPHSRDFDAVSAWERSPRTCLACHVSNPIG